MKKTKWKIVPVEKNLIYIPVIIVFVAFIFPSIDMLEFIFSLCFSGMPVAQLNLRLLKLSA